MRIVNGKETGFLGRLAIYSKVLKPISYLSFTGQRRNVPLLPTVASH